MVKQLVCIGDSITKGTYTAIGEQAPLSMATPNFAQILKERLKYDKLINYGTNGISYSALSPILPESALFNRCNEFESGDIVIVAAGTNDYGTGVIIGKETDDTDISFFGAVDGVLKCLKNKSNSGKVFVVLPIPRQFCGKNKVNHTLDDYREALKLKASKYHLPVIDGQLLCIDVSKEADRNLYMPDGTHPNEKGHKLYAELLYSTIKTYL